MSQRYTPTPTWKKAVVGVVATAITLGGIGAAIHYTANPTWMAWTPPTPIPAATPTPTVTPVPSATPTATPVPGGGTTYYVATTGSDSNPCTSSQPCATFLHATSLMQPSDTTAVEPGTYPPQMITVSGTAAQPVTVTASGPVTLTRTLPLTDSTENTAVLQVKSSQYLAVMGFTVVGAKNQPGFNSADQPYGGEVLMQNPSPGPAGEHIDIISNTVTDSNNTGIKFQDHEPDALVQGNTVTNSGANNLDHGIYASGPDATIISNTVSGGTGYGIQTWPTGGGNVGGATISGNTVYSNAMYGIVTGESPVTITANTVYSNTNGGLQVEDYSETPPAGTPANIIERNILYHNGAVSNYGTASIELGVANTSGTIIRSNTIWHDAGGAINSISGLSSSFAEPFTATDNIIETDPSAYLSPNRGILNDPLPTGGLLDYNVYHNCTATVATSGGTSYAGAHDLLATDPLFVNESSTPPNLQLQSGSPARGSGNGVTLLDGETAASRGAYPGP